MPTPAVFVFDTPHLRNLPDPVRPGQHRHSFYVDASTIPAELFDNWSEINPREVSEKTAAWRNMKTTLSEAPQRFHQGNRGLTVYAEAISYDMQRQRVNITLTNPMIHGLGDGGHTTDAVIKHAPQNGEKAFVHIDVITGFDPDGLADAIGGLNTSQAVDRKSLFNLRHNFDILKTALRGKPYESNIGYVMNDQADVDLKMVLAILGLFDAEKWRNSHPAKQFGRKETLIEEYCAPLADGTPKPAFKILVSKAAEILELRDMIEKCAVANERLRRLKADSKNPKSKKRIAGVRNHLLFLNETVQGTIPLGLLMPIVAAFRANVQWNEPEGSFSWKVPLSYLLDNNCMEPLVEGVIDVYNAENRRAEYVGRSPVAYRQAFDTVSKAVLQFQLEQAQGQR